MNAIIDQAMAFLTPLQDLIWVAALIFLRVSAAVYLMPAFGEQSVPQRVKLVIALSFTAVIFPAVSPLMADLTSLPIAAAEEVIAGLCLGIGMRFFIFALQIAAAIAAQSTSLSQMFGGASPEPQPAFGNLLTLAALALAVTTGLHVRAASLLILSYQAFPAGRFPLIADITDWGLQNAVHATVLAFSLAAPFVIASVIYNLALGVINKAMPQMPVSLVGAPAMTAGALILMAVVSPIILGIWLHEFHGFLAQPTRLGP
ncbi:flagellar biosynthetic protein FliR [Rhodobacter sp. KR11]|jgi:flagellar biosynthetic protein FliR|uniref:flagellar biosynthetic protein FliR n=1 Tax=Rhodobacter sp. KR11 TaxID=2974588 RepID=UPI0022225CD2|nr:flagellar biosynthetic protein FliR [Rhodobacter sp. KR11]MCW1919179.1 flagellar biosynthetic protein FliR [Rhodobacter sp. KR11]